MLALQFEGGAVVDVVTDIFFVGEHLMHRAARPLPPKIGENLPDVEGLGDFTLGFTLIEKSAVNPADGFLFLVRSRLQHDPVGLEALMLTDF